MENGHFSSIRLEIWKSREGPLVASLYYGYMVGNFIPILHYYNSSSAISRIHCFFMIKGICLRIQYTFYWKTPKKCKWKCTLRIRIVQNRLSLKQPPKSVHNYISWLPFKIKSGSTSCEHLSWFSYEKSPCQRNVLMKLQLCGLACSKSAILDIWHYFHRKEHMWKDLNQSSCQKCP